MNDSTLTLAIQRAMTRAKAATAALCVPDTPAPIARCAERRQAQAGTSGEPREPVQSDAFCVGSQRSKNALVRARCVRTKVRTKRTSKAQLKRAMLRAVREEVAAMQLEFFRAQPKPEPVKVRFEIYAHQYDRLSNDERAQLDRIASSDLIDTTASRVWRLVRWSPTYDVLEMTLARFGIKPREVFE